MMGTQESRVLVALEPDRAAEHFEEALRSTATRMCCCHPHLEVQEVATKKPVQAYVPKRCAAGWSRAMLWTQKSIQAFVPKRCAWARAMLLTQKSK